MLQQLDENPNFFTEIIWTDESCFPRRKYLTDKTDVPGETETTERVKSNKLKDLAGNRSTNKIVEPIFYDFTSTTPTNLDLIIPKANDLLVQKFPTDVLNNMIWH